MRELLLWIPTPVRREKSCVTDRSGTEPFTLSNSLGALGGFTAKHLVAGSAVGTYSRSVARDFDFVVVAPAIAEWSCTTPFALRNVILRATVRST